MFHKGLWGLLLCLIYENDLPQTLNETGSYFHAGYTCIVYQDKDVKKKKKSQSIFVTLWMVYNKLSISYQSMLGIIKQKQFFFSWKTTPPKLSISYKDYSIKQHNTVEYLGLYLDFNLNGESMTRRGL